MQRVRTIALLSAWAGLVWMLFARASHAPLFDRFFMDLAYNVAAVAVAVVVVVSAIIVMARLFRPPLAVRLGVAMFLILALAAVDVFWLRALASGAE